MWNGRYDEASDAVQRVERGHPESPFTLMAKPLSLGVEGRGQEAVKVISTLLLEALSTSEMVTREMAHCFALAEDVDKAITWLEINVEIGNINYLFLKEHNRFLDSLRPDSRFQKLFENVPGQWESSDL